MITLPEIVYWTPEAIMWVVIWAVVTVTTVTITIVGFARDWHSGVVGPALLIAFFGGLFGGMFVFLNPGVVYDSKVAEAKVDALEELGYSEVTLDSYGSYITSKDGEFTRVYLVGVDENAYEVLEGKKP